MADDLLDYQATFRAGSHATRVIIITTPFGKSHFYDLYQQAMRRHDPRVIEGECSRVPPLKELGHDED